MIKHVVMWKFKSEGRESNMNTARDMLLCLPAIIPEIKKMEIFFDVSGTDMSMDLMLDTEFESLEALHTYAVHPEHQKVSKFVRSVIEKRVVLDSEI